MRRPYYYNELPDLLKHTAVFCQIDPDGKIIFSGKTILERLQDETHSYEHAHYAIHIFPDSCHAFKMFRPPDNKLQISLPTIARTRNEMTLAGILIFLKKAQGFSSAIEFGIFLFYNGMGKFNEVIWDKIKSRVTPTGGISLADFITCIVMEMRSEAPTRAGFFNFQQFEMSVDNIKMWKCVFKFLTNQEKTSRNIVVHIDLLKLFFTDPLACFDVKNGLMAAPKQEPKVKPEPKATTGSLCCC